MPAPSRAEIERAAKAVALGALLGLLTAIAARRSAGRPPAPRAG